MIRHTVGRAYPRSPSKQRTDCAHHAILHARSQRGGPAVEQDVARRAWHFGALIAVPSGNGQNSLRTSFPSLPCMLDSSQFAILGLVCDAGNVS